MANNYSLIGTRPSNVNPSVTEYYNTQSGVGFENPQALSNFFNSQYGGNTNQNNIFSTLSGSPVTIQPNQLGNSQALNLPQPNNNGVLADSAIASASETNNQLKGYLDKLTYPAQPAETKANDLVSKLESLYGANTGRANATLEAEKAVGLDSIKKQLADLNAQILTKTASANAMQSAYNLTSANLENPNNPQQLGIPMNAIIGQQAQVSKMALAQRTADAAELSFLQARALGIQGQVQAAQEAVNRAVDLRFQAIEEEITAKEKQLQLIQPLLNREQQKIADAQNMMLQDEKEKIAEQKATQKANIEYAITQKVSEPYFYRGNQLIKTSTGEALYENVNGEIRRLSDGKRYSSSAEFFADSGISNWSQIHVNTAQPVKFETVTIGSGKGNIKVRYGYDEAGNVVSAINLNTGQPYPIVSSSRASSSVINNAPKPKVTPSPAPKKITLAQATNDADAFIQSVRGRDGYISPEDWRRARDAWKTDGQDVNSFYTRFKKYINPANPQDY